MVPYKYRLKIDLFAIAILCGGGRNPPTEGSCKCRFADIVRGRLLVLLTRSFIDRNPLVARPGGHGLSQLGEEPVHPRGVKPGQHHRDADIAPGLTAPMIEADRQPTSRRPRAV